MGLNGSAMNMPFIAGLTGRGTCRAA